MPSLYHVFNYSFYTSLPLIRRHIILAAECNLRLLSHAILCTILVLLFLWSKDSLHYVLSRRSLQ